MLKLNNLIKISHGGTDMQTTEEFNKIISANIAMYRKACSFTQAELADKLGYSDKSISKWEMGGGVPDAYNLARMAEIFGVTVNDLISEHKTPVTAPKKKWLDFTNKNLIMILSAGVSWLLAVVIYVVLQLCMPNMPKSWLAFIYAVSVSAIVVTVLSFVWKIKIMSFVGVTAIIWSLLLSAYLTCLPNNYWQIFLIGIPLQILAVLAFILAGNIIKKRQLK